MRYGLALVSALVIALAVTAASSAEPTQIGSKRAEAQQVLAQINAMDVQLEKAVEAWNGANVRLDQIKHDLAVNRARLETAKKNLAKARGRVSERVVALYTSNSPDALSIILGASSLGDLIERLDSANRIAQDDARIAAEVTRYRNEVQDRQQALVKAEADQEKVVAERAAQRASIQSQLAERQALYSSIKDQIAKLEAAERERVGGSWPRGDWVFRMELGTPLRTDLLGQLMRSTFARLDREGRALPVIRFRDLRRVLAAWPHGSGPASAHTALSCWNLLPG